MEQLNIDDKEDGPNETLLQIAVGISLAIGAIFCFWVFYLICLILSAVINGEIPTF